VKSKYFQSANVLSLHRFNILLAFACMVFCTDAKHKSLGGSSRLLLEDDKYSYANFKMLFTKVDLPFCFDTDSLRDDFVYSRDGELYDSIGNHKSASLIPKEFVLKWMIDTTGKHKATLLDTFINKQNFESYFNDKFYWNTIEPFIMISKGVDDVFFVLIYNQTSAMNVGYTEVLALTYTQDGLLKKVKSIGRYGVYIRTETKDRLHIFRWTKFIDAVSLQIQIKTANKVIVTIINKTEKEVQEILPSERKTSTKIKTHKKTKLVSLD